MKLHQTDYEIESDGDQEEQVFGINQAMVMGLLREKIYSNPLLACIQEVMCNARDANRENHRPRVPIQISGLNINEPNIVIRDSGVGISPKRLKYFITYGDSTKRNSNTMTGGWGLGCKSPFAVSDSFIVSTIYKDDDDPSIKWEVTYHFYINEKGLSASSTLSKNIAPPDAATYTEVKIPLERCDWSTAKSYVRQTARYWGHEAVRTSVPPKVNYGDGDEPIEDLSRLEKLSDHVFQSHNRGNLSLIIDGIEYVITDREILNSVNYSTNLIIFFNTGEVDVTPTRESVAVNEKTVTAINNKIEVASESVLEKIKTFFETLEGNPLEKSCATSRFTSDLSAFERSVYQRHHAQWTSLFLIDTTEKLDYHPPVKTDVGVTFRSEASFITFNENNNGDFTRIRTNQNLSAFHFETGLLYVSDYPTPPQKKIREASHREAEAGKVCYIVSPEIRFSRRKDEVSLEDYREERERVIPELIEEFLASLEKGAWAHVKKVRLSSLPDREKTKVAVKKADVIAAYRNSKTYQNLYPTELNVKKSVRVYRIKRRETYYDSLEDLENNNGYSRKNSFADSFIWTVNSKFAKKLGPNWICLRDFKLNREAVNKARRRKPEECFDETEVGSFIHRLWKDGFQLPPGEFADHIAKTGWEARDRLRSENELRFGEKYCSLNEFNRELGKKYPLLQCMDFTSRRMTPNNLIRHIYSYIKSIDKSSKRVRVLP